nr:MAG TPA: tail protein [Bacteriophage sp.]
MENVRVDSLLGNKKVIVGNPYSDIVLETLGKVYVKTGNNLKVLSDVLKLLEQSNEKDSTGTIIVDSQSAMEEMEYPGDGKFIFNTLTKTLYISYDERYVALITAEDGEGSDEYVKKSGDVITGRLEFTTNEAPLIVASSKLVKNFNAQYVGGYAADKLAKRSEDEYIYGNWTFKSSGTSEDTWLFKRNVRFNQDLIIDGSLSTAQFQSGYGWRLDSTTNTLTIDYLVVRKAMRVYEMVINKITATNGSIWVTNASKADNVYYPVVCSINDLDGTAGSGKLWASDTYYLFTETWSSTGYKFFIYITDYSALINNPEFTGKEMLLDEALLTREVTESDTSDFIELRNNVKLFYVYSNDFAKNVEFEYIENISDYEETGVTKTINIYDTYYGKNLNGDLLNNNFYIVVTDDEEYPLLKPNDLVRCQKWSNGNIKYYDAVVTNQLGSYSYVMQKAISVFDKYTEINYNEDGTVASMTEEYNDKLYSMTEGSESTTNVEDRLDEIAIGDDIIQMGNLIDVNRQNAIYLTSTDDYSPYIDIISELTRPDYSVVYRIPKYITDKDGNEVNYEMVKKLDSEGKPIIGSDGEPVMVKKYLYKYTKTCKVRLGNLGGIRDSTFPDNKQPRGYGLYADNVFLTGEFYLNNGQSVVDFSQDGIILKYKEAGLSITNDPDNPEKTVISIDADKVRIGNGKSDLGTLFYVEDGKAYIRTDFIKAQKIEVQEVWNYSFDETTSKFVDVPLFEGTYTPVMYESSIGTTTPDPPYGMAESSAWTGTLSKHGGSGVFKDSSLYPGSACFMESLEGEQVHIMSPIFSLKNGTLDGKLASCSVGVNMGDFIGEGEGEIKVTAYSIDTEESWNVPFKWASRGTLIYELSTVETTAATNNLVFAISLIPASKESVRRVIVNISMSYNYHEGALNWALWKDGSGSLAREKIHWTSDGELTINGDFRSTNGQTTILMGNNSKSAYLSMFSNATEEHPLLYMRYRNVGSGNSVTIEVDSEYTHDDIYYSRVRLTCEGLAFGYTQKGYLDSIITSGMGYTYISMDKYNGFQYSGGDFSFAAGSVVLGMSIVSGGRAFTIRPNNGGVCFNYGSYPGTGGSAWPTSRNDVSIGGVYVNPDEGILGLDGTLKVKLK